MSERLTHSPKILKLGIDESQRLTHFRTFGYQTFGYQTVLYVLRGAVTVPVTFCGQNPERDVIYDIQSYRYIICLTGIWFIYLYALNFPGNRARWRSKKLRIWNKNLRSLNRNQFIRNFKVTEIVKILRQAISSTHWAS